SIYGGTGFFQQYEDIKNAEAIVATPGRLLDHLRRGTIKLHDVKFVVLDEADKMLEMGFEEDVESIINHTPKTRQTVFFSATMPPAALRLIHKYMKNPELIKEKLQVDRTLLKQVFYDIPMENKFSLLVKLLKDAPGSSAIVFCGTKRNVDKVAQGLRKNKIRAMPVHGDLTQARRLQAVNFLKSGKIDVLVATDVAARGLDIKDVTHIFNYDVPRTPDEYVHRIGRTARAGKKGEAVTLLSQRDYQNFENVLRDRSLDIVESPVPAFENVKLEREHYGGSGGYSRGRESYGGRRNYGGDRAHETRSNYGGGRNYGTQRSHDRRPHRLERNFESNQGSELQTSRGNSGNNYREHRTGNAASGNTNTRPHFNSHKPYRKKFHGSEHRGRNY
ncbi:MAG: DEAD/DEAH box helicase, partial [archaeon]